MSRLSSTNVPAEINKGTDDAQHNQVNDYCPITDAHYSFFAIFFLLILLSSGEGFTVSPNVSIVQAATAACFSALLLLAVCVCV